MASVAHPNPGLESPGGSHYVEITPGKIKHILGSVLDSPAPQLLPSGANMSQESLVAKPLPRDASCPEAFDVSAAHLRVEGPGGGGAVDVGGQNPSLHFCKLCHVWISGELNCRAHLAGRKHIKRSQLHQEQQQQQKEPTDRSHDGIMTITDQDSMQAAAAHGNINFEEAARSSMLMPVSEANQSMVPLYQCSLCNITATSLDHLEAHYRGVKHQKRLGLAAMKAGSESSSIVTDSGTDGPVCPGAAFTCTICGITCSSLDNLQTHCRGRKHTRKVLQHQSQMRGDGVDPMSSAMAAASASLAAISLPDPGAQKVPQMEHMGVHQQPNMLPPHCVPHPGVMHMPSHIMPGMYHQMQSYQHHQMMGSMMPQGEMYMHHPMPPMYMQAAMGPPWSVPAHIAAAHPHHYMPRTPPPPPSPPWTGYQHQQQELAPHHHQHHHQPPPPRIAGVVIEEERPTENAEVPNTSISFNQADTTEAEGSVLVARDETDDELCLSSGHSTPVSLVHSAVHEEEEEEDADRSEEEVLLVTSPLSGSRMGHHSFRLAATPSWTPTRAPQHRRGLSDSGFQFHETPLDLELLDRSLNELASQEPAGTPSLCLHEVPVAEAASRSVRSLASRRMSDAGDLAAVGASRAAAAHQPRHQHSLSLDGSLETASTMFSNMVPLAASDGERPAGSGKTARLLFDDHLFEGPVGDTKLSPIGGSSRSQGGSRPSTAGESRPPAAAADQLGASVSMQRADSLGSFDPSVGVPLAPLVSSAVTSPAGSLLGSPARHVRSQSLCLPRDGGSSRSGFGGFACGFTAHDLSYAAGQPLPPDGSDTSSLPGTFSALGSPAGSPVRGSGGTPGHHRHQSLFLPGKSNLGVQHQLSSVVVGSDATRPPLYRTLSGASASSGAAANGSAAGLMPPQASSGGIWTMTASERRKSSSGAWEDELDDDGTSDEPAPPPQVVPTRPALDEAPETGSAGNQSGDSSLELSALIHSTSAQPGEAQTITATDNPVFELSASLGDGSAAEARHRCELCGISATSAEHLTAHYSGRRHQKNLAAVCRQQPGEGGAVGTNAGGGHQRYSCPLCSVSATSEAHLEAHFHGKQHQRKLAAASGTSAVLPTFHCSLCGINATSGEHLMSHFQGKQHQRKARLAEQQTPQGQGGYRFAHQQLDMGHEVVSHQQSQQWYPHYMPSPQEMADPRQFHGHHHGHPMGAMMHPHVMGPMGGYQQHHSHPAAPLGWWQGSDGGAFMQPHHELPMQPWMGHVVPMMPGQYL